MVEAASIPLVLGTAQLGLRYGIANTSGQPNQDRATEIVRTAWDNGIREFDTAQAYGRSEEVLGEAMRRLGVAGQASVISKFNPDLDHLDVAVMGRALGASLTRLGVEQLEGIMLHREESLDLWADGLGAIARSLIHSGQVRRIGVSVYSPGRALEALLTDGIDMVQIPMSILDRRFWEAGVFTVAAARDKRIYVRSIYLQGLILMASEEIPAALSAARPVIERVEGLARRLGLSRRELALLALKSVGSQARIVFGAEQATQVSQNVASWQQTPPPGLWDTVAAAIGQVDEQIFNPAKWPK